MREACDSDSDEEAVQVPRPSSSKKTQGSVIWAASSSPSTTKATLGRFRDEEESDDSEDGVQYVRTERAELSQSLMTSWLVPRRPRKARRV